MKTERRPAVTTDRFCPLGGGRLLGPLRVCSSTRDTAIAASERRIDFGAGRFERSVEAMATRHVEDILTTHEIAGLKLFVDPSNCTQCHNLLAALWRLRRGPVVQQPPGYPVIRSRPCLINHPFR
jgi:hypothetical protein